jgi:hypothetical protein
MTKKIASTVPSVSPAPLTPDAYADLLCQLVYEGHTYAPTTASNAGCSLLGLPLTDSVLLPGNNGASNPTPAGGMLTVALDKAPALITALESVKDGANPAEILYAPDRTHPQFPVAGLSPETAKSYVKKEDSPFRLRALNLAPSTKDCDHDEESKLAGAMRKWPWGKLILAVVFGAYFFVTTKENFELHNSDNDLKTAFAEIAGATLKRGKPLPLETDRFELAITPDGNCVIGREKLNSALPNDGWSRALRQCKNAEHNAP